MNLRVGSWYGWFLRDINEIVELGYSYNDGDGFGDGLVEDIKDQLSFQDLQGAEYMTDLEALALSCTTRRRNKCLKLNSTTLRRKRRPYG